MSIVPLVKGATVSALLLFVSATTSAADRVRAAYAALNGGQAPLWVAQDRGIYAKHGLQVELIYLSGGSTNVQALIGNSIQFAAGGPASVEGRARGLKLVIIANPQPVAVTNLVTAPHVSNLAELRTIVGGVSRFGASQHQGLLYLVRKNGGNPKDLKVLQLGGDPNRLAALKIGTVQYTFLGASATEQAKSLGFKVLATAKQLGIPFPWTSVVVHEAWLDRNRDLAYRYVKSLTEAVWFMKHYRGESERIIAKYLKLPPILAAAEYDFNIDTFPELPYPTIEGVSLILANLSPDNPDAAGLNARDFVDSSIVDQIKREAFVNSLR